MPAGDDEKAVEGEDQHFVETVIEDQLLTASQIAECLRTQQRLLVAGERRTLAEIATQKTLISQTQADRIEQENLPGHVPKQVGNYEILRKIGEGGMGTVYKARHVKLDSYAAIKFLPAHLGQDDSFVARFEREAKLAAQLSSPYCVRTFDVAEVEGARAIMMEYVEGESLDGLLRREGRLAEQKALRIVRHVAGALDEAHEFGIIHRDIKPANILLTRRGLPKLADLGLAKTMHSEQAALTAAGSILGTPSYMSPEQAMGLADLDARSDIFSLGATLYRMVVGDLPFKGETPVNVMHKIATEPFTAPLAQNPHLSRETAAILCKMMAKDRGERYQTMAEVIRDIQAVLSGEQTGLEYEETLALVTHQEAPTQLAAPTRKRRTAWIALLAAGVAAAAGAGFLVARQYGLFAPSPEAPAKPPVSAGDLVAQARAAAAGKNWEQALALAQRVAAEFPHAPETAEAAAIGQRATREITLGRLVTLAAKGDLPSAVKRLREAREQWSDDPRVEELRETIEARVDKGYNDAMTEAAAAEKQSDFAGAASAYRRALALRATPDAEQNLQSAEFRRQLVQAAKTTDARGKLLAIADVLRKSGDASNQAVQAKMEELIGARRRALTARERTVRFQKHMPPDVRAAFGKAEQTAADSEKQIEALDPLAMTTETLGRIAAGFSDACDQHTQAALDAFDALYPGIDRDLAGTDFAAGLLRLHAAKEQHPDFPAVQQLVAKHDPTGGALAVATLVAAAAPRAAAYSSQQEAVDACAKLDEAWRRCERLEPKTGSDKKVTSLKVLVLARRGAARLAGGAALEALADASAAADLGASDAAFRDVLSSGAARGIAEFGGALEAGKGRDFVQRAAALLKGKKGAAARGALARAITTAPFATEFMRDVALVRAWTEAVGPFQPPGMADVPAGTYPLGLKYTGLVTLAPSNSPEHPVKLVRYFLDSHEVTNEEFQAFVSAGGYTEERWWVEAKGVDRGAFVDATGKPGPLFWRAGRCPKGEEKRPVVGISFYEAAAYARWAGKRLPTEAEWECAALGVPPEAAGQPFGKRPFPWGEKYVEGHANLREAKAGKPEPAGARPTDKAVCGCLNMVGNVREWTCSSYDAYPGTKCQDKRFGKGMVSVRGACFADSFIGAGPATRRAADKATREALTGFRCAWPPTGGRGGP